MLKKVAEEITIQSFLNCYIRETNNIEILEHFNYYPEESKLEELKWARINLCEQGIQILVRIKHWSVTGRHNFTFPIFMQNNENASLKSVDYIWLSAVIIKELLLVNGKDLSEDELMSRIIMSCQTINLFLQNREKDFSSLNRIDFDFIETEQSLLFGHLMHPTPKSRQGMNEEKLINYSPETKGKFQLHYFRIHKSSLEHDSNLNFSAIEIVKNSLLNDQQVTEKFKEIYCQDDEYGLVPVHPLQAEKLLSEKEINKLINKGIVQYLGAQGRLFTPTSSVRTVYSSELEYMYKFSVPIKITNSLRVNKQKELYRGVEVDRLLESNLGTEMEKEYPNFKIIRDPAYLMLKGKNESGFEVVIRENPFTVNNKEQVSLVAGLTQDHPNSCSRLSNIIKKIAMKENKTVRNVSEKWFNRYLAISLEPMLWLYHTYGIALEAHQQNSLVKLHKGYPTIFYYRDNQGYYYCESQISKLRDIIPSLSNKSQTICSDEVANERLRYYLFFNHLFGIINSFGIEGLVEEEILVNILRERLKKLSTKYESSLISSLLYQKFLPCKANLLTRFHDMDELVGPLADQSVYVEALNPIYK